MTLQNTTMKRHDMLRYFLKLNDYFIVDNAIQLKNKEFSFNIDLRNKRNMSREEIQTFFEKSGFIVTGNEVLYKGLMRFKAPYLKISVKESSPYLDLYKITTSKNNMCSFGEKGLTTCAIMKAKLEESPVTKKNSFVPVFERNKLVAIKDPDTPLTFCPFCGSRVAKSPQLNLFSAEME